MALDEVVCPHCAGYGWRWVWRYPRTPLQHKARAHVPVRHKLYCLPCRGTGYRRVRPAVAAVITRRAGAGSASAAGWSGAAPSALWWRGRAAAHWTREYRRG